MASPQNQPCEHIFICDRQPCRTLKGKQGLFPEGCWSLESGEAQAKVLRWPGTLQGDVVDGRMDRWGTEERRGVEKAAQTWQQPRQDQITADTGTNLVMCWTGFYNPQPLAPGPSHSSLRDAVESTGPGRGWSRSAWAAGEQVWVHSDKQLRQDHGGAVRRTHCQLLLLSPFASEREASLATLALLSLSAVCVYVSFSFFFHRVWSCCRSKRRLAGRGCGRAGPALSRSGAAPPVIIRVTAARARLCAACAGRDVSPWEKRASICLSFPVDTNLLPACPTQPDW
ncbi:hypothetical protein SRHO_G00133500 [Serrasalmus rhombeus]